MVQGSGLGQKQTAEYRMSNTEGRNSIDHKATKDRAERFHPSKFNIQNSAVLRFAFTIPER
jgi:hypothetical protein